MSGLHDIQTRGIILRTADSRGSDRILKILCEDRGVISALAKGARNSKRRFSGGLDIFDMGRFTFRLSERNNTLPIVLELSERKVLLALREHFDKFSVASTLLEVTSLFSPEGDSEAAELFLPLWTTLEDIQRETVRSEMLRRCALYLVLVLQHAGFHSLEERSDLDAESRDFLGTLSPTERFSSPAPTGQIISGIWSLVHYAERIHGFGLRSKEALRQALSSAQALEQS